MIYHLSHNEKYGGWCVASKDQLSKWSDLSIATIKRHIVTLCEKDLVSKNERGWLRTKDSYNEMIANKEDYLIGFNGKESRFLSGKKSTAQNEPGGIKMSQEGYQNDTPSGIKMSHNNNIYIYKDNNYLIDEAFQSFYELYPRKKAKAKAFQAFKKVKPSEFQALMTGLVAQLPELMASEEKFRPYPASWLNARRWEDGAAVPVEKDDQWYLEEMKKIGDARFRTLYGKELSERITPLFYATWNS